MGGGGREDRKEASCPALVRHLDVAQVRLRSICTIFYTVFFPYSFFYKIVYSTFGGFLVEFTQGKIVARKMVHIIVFFSVLLGTI